MLQFLRTRYFWKTMDCKVLQPPEKVCSMKILRREAFQKCVQVPCLRVPENCINRILPIIKDKLLKMQQLRPVRDLEGDVDSGKSEIKETVVKFKEILLHPEVNSWNSLPTEKLMQYQVTSKNFHNSKINLTYANWRADEILDCVLSKEVEGLTSYSRIGHIIHLNLRDHLLPYKYLIAQVFADKLNGIRTVVNKAANIDNTYRNFELELLHGEPDYKVETKENGIVFEFDFSLVYWNPRLSTEHQRIVDMIQPNDVLYDVFAGVGPFSVPAAKKRCRVFANDLNPESFRWLAHNMKRNKCTEYSQLFNKDGRDFIREDLKQDLLKRGSECKDISSLSRNYDFHITMNLPALAVEFLNEFRGLFQPNELAAFEIADQKLPLVHVYTFAKGADTKQLAISLVEKNLGSDLSGVLQSACFVRNVAPNKDMYRISFRLTKELLTSKQNTTRSGRCLKRPFESVDAIKEETNLKLKQS